MEIKDNVISLFERRLQRQKAKDDALEQAGWEYEWQCQAMFLHQHSDDDSFENVGEFEFKKDS